MKQQTIQITERPDVKTSEILKLMKEKFSVWSYYDDKRLDEEFPAPNEAIVAEFLDSAEPDAETLGLSVKEVEAKGIKNGITLRQRMLLELAYFEKHGTHMDIKGVTFCSGSRSSDGSVPCMRWYSGGQGVGVYWYVLDNSGAEYGVRSAVSLLSSDSFPSELTDEKAIAHLKANGYKITKEKTVVEEF